MLFYIRSVFEWVNEFPSSIAIRESIYFYPAVLTTHVVGMCVFAGLVIMMDLRLLGIGNTGTPISQIQRRLFPWQMVGMTISAVTGLVLVYGQPMRFYPNIFFWIKTVMMLVAGANVMAFHYGAYRQVAKWDNLVKAPLGARLSGAVSIVLWALVIVSGRLIAYNWFQ
jgi:cytochrome b subunit of formate dehydrogenase